MTETLKIISRYPQLFNIVDGEDGYDVYFVDQGISTSPIDYNYIGRNANTSYDLRMFCHDESIYFGIKDDASQKGGDVSWNDKILEHPEFMMALAQYNFCAYKIVEWEKKYYDLVNIVRNNTITEIVNHV